MLTQFRTKIDHIREKELHKAMKKFGHLSENDQQAIALLTRSIVNKILHQPTVRLKEATTEQDGRVFIDALNKLFDLSAGPEGNGGGKE